MPRIIPINNKRHLNIKIKTDLHASHSQTQHITPVVIHEFAAACHDYPIIFVKDNETGQFRVVALLGLKPGSNVFYTADGWQADYLPESLRAHPFLLAPNTGIADELVLCFDEESDLVNEKEGEPLFNSKGEQTEYTKKTGDFLSELYQKRMQTQDFIKQLLDKSLLTAKTLEVKIEKEEKINIEGLYTIDEEALNNLPDEAFTILRKQNYLLPIYASLLSMSQIGKVVNLTRQIK